MCEKDLTGLFEVIVVGGGPSGICAAIASARGGAKTLLLEEDQVIGGCITDYFVAMLCGGPVTGIIKELEDICKSRYRLPNGTNWFLPSSWIKAINDLFAGEPNLQVSTGAKVIGVERKNNIVDRITVDCGYFNLKVNGKIFIDASGSGIFSEMAGCEVMYGRDAKRDFNEPHAADVRDDKVQNVTWMYISHKLPGYKPFDMSKLEYARRGVLPQGMTWFHLDPAKALAQDDGVYLHWGCMTECRDTRNSIEIAKSQCVALDLMRNDLALLQKNGYVVHLAPRIGIRECRRIKGHHVLNEMDICNNVYHEDTIACGNYCLDLWGESIEHQPITGYGIPYRSLLPLRIDNLLLAGKLISGSHIAMSAYRVMPIAGSIGQAAGTAASLCVKYNTLPARLDSNTVINELKSSHHDFILRLSNS